MLQAVGHNKIAARILEHAMYEKATARTPKLCQKLPVRRSTS